jgi:hypothetical protein
MQILACLQPKKKKSQNVPPRNARWRAESKLGSEGSAQSWTIGVVFTVFVEMTMSAASS